MLDLTFPLHQQLPAAFVLGCFTHYFIFRHDTWDGRTLSIISCGSVLAWALWAFEFSTNPGKPTLTTWLEAWFRAWGLFSVYLAGLTFSIILYRSLWHRLRDFPGPKLARVSGWWWTWRYARRLHMYDELMALHAEYGDFVRIGRQSH